MEYNKSFCGILLRSIQSLFEIILLIVTSYFVWGMIQEYLAGNTNFSVTKVPITLEDIPALVICIESKTENERVLRYGKDISISTINSHFGENDTKSTLINFQEGNNEYSYSGNKREIFLDEWEVYQTVNQRSCISMLKWSPFDSITLESFYS